MKFTSDESLTFATYKCGSLRSGAVCGCFVSDHVILMKIMPQVSGSTPKGAQSFRQFSAEARARNQRQTYADADASPHYIKPCHTRARHLWCCRANEGVRQMTGRCQSTPKVIYLCLQLEPIKVPLESIVSIHIKTLSCAIKRLSPLLVGRKQRSTGGK